MVCDDWNVSEDNGTNLSLSITLGGASFEAAGPANLVMQVLEEFKTLVSTAPAMAGAAPAGAANPGTATGPQTSAASKIPLPQFLSSKAISGNAKIATAIVAWAADHENKSSLSASEIKSYWKNTTVKVPGNLTRDIDSAKKQGWLTAEGRTYVVTGFGRTAIGLS